MAIQSTNPYAGAHTAGEIRKVSDTLMKESQKTKTAQKNQGAPADYNVNISPAAKKKANPYENAHTAAEIRKVSDTLMKNYTKAGAA